MAFSLVALTSCARETSFFQKSKDADATKQTLETPEPPKPDANAVPETAVEGAQNDKALDPKKEDSDEGEDLEDLDSSAGGQDLLQVLLGQLGGGGGGLDISKLGSLKDLIGLLLPGLGDPIGQGKLGDLLGALGGPEKLAELLGALGGGGSILDIFKKPPPPGGNGGIGPKGIFGKVSPAPANDTSGRADTFCKAAGSAKQITSGLRSLLDEICSGETAKSALITKLITQAYTGSNKLEFHTFRALASDAAAQTSGLRYAFAVKLPGRAKDHFDVTAPMQLEADQLKAFLEGGGGGTATVSILESYANDGEFHVRGVRASQKLDRQIFTVAVSIESETRYDHHVLEDDKYYMYTSTITKAVSGIQTTDTIGLAIQDGESAYLISLVDIVAPNRGFGPFVEAELEKTAEKTAKAMYAAMTEAE
jgi:hypothetical protein